MNCCTKKKKHNRYTLKDHECEAALKAKKTYLGAQKASASRQVRASARGYEMSELDLKSQQPCMLQDVIKKKKYSDKMQLSPSSCRLVYHSRPSNISNACGSELRGYRAELVKKKKIARYPRSFCRFGEPRGR